MALLSRREWIILAACLAVPVWFATHEHEHPPTAPAVTPQSRSDPAGTPAQQAAAIKMIRAFGYQCDWVDAILPYALSEGATVWCNHHRYTFYIENHGGKWSVKSD